MDRLIDAAAVLLFAGATAFVAMHARGWISAEPREETPAVTEPPAPYAARVAEVLPRLEAHVAAGSMRDRPIACDMDERLADIAAIEEVVGATDDATLAVPLAEGIAALRECVACTPEPRGCAAAARSFARVEERLSLPRAGSGI